MLSILLVVSHDELAALIVLYKKHKYDAVCIDIETTKFNGDIAILGAYTPAEGAIRTIQLIRGYTLNKENVEAILKEAKLIITFNGTKHDLPKIAQQFSHKINQIPHLDLYALSSSLGSRKGLKALEKKHKILRTEPYKYWRRKAIKLWKGHEAGNPKSLPALLRYNENDCVNLFPLAEELTKQFWKKWIVQKLNDL